MKCAAGLSLLGQHGSQFVLLDLEAGIFRAALDNRAQKAVIRADEEPVMALCNQAWPVGSHARVYHGEEDCAPRELAKAEIQDECGLSYVLWGDVMGKIDYRGGGAYGVDNALYYPCVWVRESKVRKKDYWCFFHGVQK